MKAARSPLKVYLYLVSFVALILIIIGAVNLTRSAIAYLAPVYEQDNPFIYEDLTPWEEAFGPEFIAAEKERSSSIIRENSRRALMRDLAAGAAFLVAALPVYLYHWRRVASLENEPKDA